MQTYATREEAAEILRSAVSQLDRWRQQGKLTPIKLGRRKVLYRISDLHDFIEKQAKKGEASREQ